jgi:hypothetical protein
MHDLKGGGGKTDGVVIGFFGTRPLLALPTEHGHGDLTYEIVSQPEFPGWVYMRY